MLVLSGIFMFGVIGGISLLSHYYTLNGIKSRTVGDGQHGTARFATKKEIGETYVEVPYEPEKWRKGENLPKVQGLVLGSIERAGKLYALVDTGDVHCLMIGAAGVGKTYAMLEAAHQAQKEGVDVVGGYVEPHARPDTLALLEGLEALKGTGTNAEGICQFPDGKLYYQYLVDSSIGPTYQTMDDLQKAIEDQIDDSLSAMSQIMKQNPEINDELDQFHFSESDPEKILSLLKGAVSEDFPEVNGNKYTTKNVPKELEQSLNPAFFLVPPIDDYKNCTIYINGGSSAGTDTLFTTLAHEGIPGHLYQNVYFLSHCDDPVRKVLSFLGYREGWAVYSEYYAYTLDTSVSPEVSQIMAYNASAMLGLHALIDLNVNYYGWTQDQVADYLKQFFSIDQEQVAEAIYQAVRSNPSNYVAYYGGYCEIMKMKTEAENTLKEQFQPLRFHQFLLDMGPMPFAVMDRYFKAWLLTYSLGGE